MRQLHFDGMLHKGRPSRACGVTSTRDGMRISGLLDLKQASQRFLFVSRSFAGSSGLCRFRVSPFTADKDDSNCSCSRKSVKVYRETDDYFSTSMLHNDTECDLDTEFLGIQSAGFGRVYGARRGPPDTLLAG